MDKNKIKKKFEEKRWIGMGELP